MAHPAASKVPLVANPIRCASHPIEYGQAPPLLGEHTQQVLGDVLGMSGDEIERLRAQGVI